MKLFSQYSELCMIVQLCIPVCLQCIACRDRRLMAAWCTIISYVEQHVFVTSEMIV